jgi:hypothetical protein
MKWHNLGIFTLTNEWQLTTPIKAELFRITHLSTPIEKDYIKSLIAQGFEEGEMISIFAPRLLSCRQEREIFLFSLLNDVEKQLTFKRLDSEKDIIWKIKIEYIEL